MSQITWKNISVPGNSDPTRPIAAAEKTFSKAFDSVNRVIERQQDIRSGNFDNITKNNDLAIRANIEQLNDLAAFNKTKPNFMISKLKEKYGVQFTPDDVDKIVTSQQTKLREEAYQSAAAVGGQIADENFDVLAGGQAVSEKLIAMGMSPQLAQQRGNQWAKGAQLRQGQYDKAKATNTDDMMTKLHAGEQPKTLDEARQKVMDMASEYGGMNRVDTKYAITSLQNQLRDRQSDTEYSKNENEYDRKEKIRRQVNQYGAEFRADVAATGNFDTVMQKMSNIKNQEVYNQLAATVLTGLKTTANMNQEQQLESQRIQSAAQNEISKIDATNQNQRAVLHKKMVDAQGFSQEAEDFVTNIAVKGDNFVKAVTENAQGTGWLTRVVNGKVKHNKDAIKAVNSEYQKMIANGVDAKTAQAILFQTINDNVDRNQNFMFEGEGIDSTALGKKLTENIKKYDGSKKYRNDLIAFDQDVAKEKTDLEFQTNNMLLDHIELSRKKNLGSKVEPGNFKLNVTGSAIQNQLTRENSRVNIKNTSNKSPKDKTNTGTTENKRTLDKIAKGNAFSKLNNYTDITQKNGYLIGKNKHGQLKQIMKIPRRTFYLRDKNKSPEGDVTVNPKYAEYLQAIKKLNIK